MESVGKVFDKGTGEMVEVYGTILGSVCRNPIFTSSVPVNTYNAGIYKDYIFLTLPVYQSSNAYRQSVYILDKSGNLISTSTSSINSSAYTYLFLCQQRHPCYKNELVGFANINGNYRYWAPVTFDSEYRVMCQFNGEDYFITKTKLVQVVTSGNSGTVYVAPRGYASPSFSEISLGSSYGSPIGFIEDTIYLYNDSTKMMHIINLNTQGRESMTCNLGTSVVCIDETKIYMVSYTTNGTTLTLNLRGYIYDMQSKTVISSGGYEYAYTYHNYNYNDFVYIYSDAEYHYFIIGKIYCRMNITSGYISYVQPFNQRVSYDLFKNAAISKYRYVRRLSNSPENGYVTVGKFIISFEKSDIKELVLCDNNASLDVSYTSSAPIWPRPFATTRDHDAVYVGGSEIPAICNGSYCGQTQYATTQILFGDALWKTYTNF